MNNEIKKINTFETTPDMVGKFINRYLWTDVIPVGKIVAIKSKTIVLVRRVKPSENKTKMEYLVGGFSAHCPNNTQQSYDFHETDEIFEMRLSKSMMRSFKLDDAPRNYYDYNF
jgi:hypothetical protein